MGRHSIPGPDDDDEIGYPDAEDSDDEVESLDDADGAHQVGGHVDAPAASTAGDSASGDYDPDDYDPGDDEAESGDYDDPEYDESEYAEPGDDAPDYRAAPTRGSDSFQAPSFEAPSYAAGSYEPVDGSVDNSVDEDKTVALGAVPPSRPAPPDQGGHRNDGEWTGSHRTVAPGRRGVSFGVIAALVTVVVVVAGVILWRFFGDALSNRSDVAAGRCVQGDATVSAVVDPAIADTLNALATKFNESATPVGDHCVSVGIQAADSNAVIDGLAGTWPEQLGDKPALWIPGSSVSTARLQAKVDPKTISASTSLATSPVLLAVRPELKPALAQQNWGTLPGLQSNPTALDGLKLPGWGSLRLALPTSGDSDAGYLAAEAVAVASVPAGAPASGGNRAVSTLRAGQPKLADGSTDTAMAALLDSTDPAKSEVHAVVITEQQLFARASELPDAKDTVASWLPPGPVAVADFPAVLFGGDWLEDEQVSAASRFERFLRDPEQLAELSAAGFRTGDETPPGNDVVPFATLPSTLSVGDESVRVALATAMEAPAIGPAVSIMLDRSLNLGAVVDALNARIDALPANASVGLTTFDGQASATPVALGPLSDPVDGRPRNEVLTSTLAGLGATTNGAVSFTTLRNLYSEALTGFREGQSNSVLVITAGPHTDQSLDSAGLQDLIRSSADPARPVAVNVINIGADPDQPTWEAVAEISGGTYQNVPASDSPELVAALNTMLG